tara:strand:- start:791 stop:1201 length:411 start_codon:yes stop_codon:yes gene_type:complete
MKKKNKHSEVELPSNRKFGFFFSFVFLIFSTYFFFSNVFITAFIFFVLAVAFLVIVFVKADALFFLNKLWSRLGFVLGIIISPIILAIIFFVFFTPYGLVMRIFGRDELRLKFKKKESYWKPRKQMRTQINFRQQF